jgi:hypothetical protein
MATAAERKPNVIFILVDDMGYGDLGCYGATDIRTPNIDRLAREGVKLTDSYSNGPGSAYSEPEDVGILENAIAWDASLSKTDVDEPAGTLD